MSHTLAAAPAFLADLHTRRSMSTRFEGTAPTNFGAFEDKPARDCRTPNRHLQDQMLLAWLTDPTLRVDGSNDSVAATLVDHLGDPALSGTALELARLIADAAGGRDVRLRAKLLMSVVMEHHARFYGVDA